ncbi:agamous-like MADS-box protein AGL80 [Salvia miltiorrhiza]|uniref:agamous-like MADS-box protein AGL80 n=1 Tax=Salvia miltiorrhiza TaxID=226208 RepID=UPI0025AD30A3|nr:agamous-like MADS-box protein AGL80 [Salvia miltiorrhiza]
MTRKKVKLAFIINDSARKATFKKRKKGLLKKVSELSTLCGIESCAIVYSPYESGPEVWPDAGGAGRVVAQFKRMPEMEQSKKMVNQESFIRQRVAKAAEQLKKLHKDNREKEVTHLMYHCLAGKGLHGLPLPDLNDMAWLLDHNLKEIYKRIEGIKKQQQRSLDAGGGGEGQQQQQWVGEQPQQQMGGGFGEEMIVPFSDGSSHAAAMWSNLFFP